MGRAATTRIYVLDKNGKPVRRSIKRSSLKNYQRTNDKVGQRWIFQKLRPSLRKFRHGVRVEEGKTVITEKRYLRFRFSMWRHRLDGGAGIPDFIKKARARYARVKNEAPEFKAQRIGVGIASDPKEFVKFRNAKTKRLNKKEAVDLISTESIARNEKSTEVMFEQLASKLNMYFLKSLESPSLLDEDGDKVVKDFFVFFTEL